MKKSSVGTSSDDDRSRLLRLLCFEPPRLCRFRPCMSDMLCVASTVAARARGPLSALPGSGRDMYTTGESSPVSPASSELYDAVRPPPPSLPGR